VQQAKESGIPWIVVIVFCIVFWPAGLLLLWLKMRSDLKTTMIASEIVQVVAWVLFVFFGACLIVAMIEEGFSDQSPVWGILIFVSGAAALLVTSVITKRNARLYKRLINIVVNDGVTRIDEISRIMDMPYERVYRYLENMFNRSYLPNGHISEVKRAVVLERREKERKPGLKYDVVYCRNCGAHELVPVDGFETCDFCGSILKVVRKP